MDEKFGRTAGVMLAAGDADGLNQALLGEFSGEAAVVMGKDANRRIGIMKMRASERTGLWFCKDGFVIVYAERPPILRI